VVLGSPFSRGIVLSPSRTLPIAFPLFQLSAEVFLLLPGPPEGLGRASSFLPSRGKEQGGVSMLSFSGLASERERVFFFLAFSCVCADADDLPPFPFFAPSISQHSSFFFSSFPAASRRGRYHPESSFLCVVPAKRTPLFRASSPAVVRGIFSSRLRGSARSGPSFVPFFPAALLGEIGLLGGYLTSSRAGAYSRKDRRAAALWAFLFCGLCCLCFLGSAQGFPHLLFSLDWGK